MEAVCSSATLVMLYQNTGSHIQVMITPSEPQISKEETDAQKREARKKSNKERKRCCRSVETALWLSEGDSAEGNARTLCAVTVYSHISRSFQCSHSALISWYLWRTGCRGTVPHDIRCREGKGCHLLKATARNPFLTYPVSAETEASTPLGLKQVNLLRQLPSSQLISSIYVLIMS
jgi:hypothetical protein